MNIKINAGGQDFTLNFSVNYFYKYFKEGTGFDLFTIREQQIDVSRLVEFTFGLLYGGYMAECKINKEKPALTKEQLEEIVWSMTPDESSKIVNAYNTFVTPGEPAALPAQ